MKLVIVESPAKCQKIQGFLGEGYKVVATMGHIRALEETIDSVGISRNWDPKYAELKTKKEAISKLRAAAKGAEVIIATDDDREGEGIGWHVCFILKKDPATTPRIVFHEITKQAIIHAAAHPKTLDMNKVNAQQARAMLDLLVGFTISRVLWNRVAPKLSAGRCQTPALRLVVERDQEVENHKAAAFWRLSGMFKHATKQIEGTANADIPTAKEASDILHKVHTNTKATILSVKESVSTSQPPKPLITSTLQQEASSLFGLNPKVTMNAAQKLYEAGHITYMRTDNPLISAEAALTIRAHVIATYGQEFVGSEGQHTIKAENQQIEKAEKAEKQEKTKTKKSNKAVIKTEPELPANQAAHEAIRPTHPEAENPSIDDAVQKKVYTLIWRRATQSQMAPALTDVRKASIELNADKGRPWTIEQTKVNFAGFRILENNDKTRQDEEKQAWLLWQSNLKEQAVLDWITIRADESFTKPKGRYTEASLIAELEKRGIGRPSTFATLVSTIVDRGYVEKTNVEGKSQDSMHLTIKPNVWPPTERRESHKVGAEKNKMRATSLGKSITTYLDREYNDLFAYAFTAQMEQNLDEISKGTKPWKSLLQETWDTYKDRYAEHTTGNSAANKAAR
jgi:DNA topoisomerase-1